MKKFNFCQFANIKITNNVVEEFFLDKSYRQNLLLYAVVTDRTNTFEKTKMQILSHISRIQQFI